MDSAIPAVRATQPCRRHAGTDFAQTQCSASQLLRWFGMGADVGPVSDARSFPVRRVRQGAPLVYEGSPCEHVYVVGAGSFKCIQTERDGYEQVQGFALCGDAIGLDGLAEGRCATGAIALEDASVVCLGLRDLEEATRAIPVFERLLLRAASRELMRRNLSLQAMAAVGAEVRVARFLMHMTQRQVELDLPALHIHLRMSRRDIASYLGVAHETVSRSLTTLSDLGLIRVALREVDILDPAGLDAFQATTRGLGAAPAAIVTALNKRSPEPSFKATPPTARHT